MNVQAVRVQEISKTRTYSYSFKELQDHFLTHCYSDPSERGAVHFSSDRVRICRTDILVLKYYTREIWI